MRRSTKLASVVAVATLTLAGCANDSKDADTDTTSASDDLNCDDASGDGPKVGLAYDVGGQGDNSFNDAAAAGMAKAVSDLSATCKEGEAQDGESEDAREDRLQQLADAGYNPIIAVGFAYSDAVNAVAPDYPEASFAVVDGYDPDDKPNDNVAYLGFAENEGSFLVGVAAAEKTQTDHIGFVGGVHNDLIKKFEAGYTAGAEAVNPDITVDVKYIEESDLSGFADTAGGKAAAAGMYDNGADIVYHAAGASGSGVFDAAVDAGDGMWAIGVDSDQYLSASDAQKPHILTSMLKRVDVATYNMIESIANDEPLTSYVVYDLAADGVGYSESNEQAIDGLTDGIDDYAEQIKSGDIDDYAAKIKSGEIKVPTVPAS